MAAKSLHMLYGTAWKKERTNELVQLAVRNGFRGIDTACQPKHYNEKGVGDALSQLYQDGVVTRDDLFLQTKFTPIQGQDPSQIPYDSSASLADQVRQSFFKSCLNLRTQKIDSLLLHSPILPLSDTMIVWRTFEEIVEQKRLQFIGISNCYDLEFLRNLYEQAIIKPSFVQNRFYAVTGYDTELREFCDAHAITYQSFWTLTGNPSCVKSHIIHTLAKKYGKTAEQIWFTFVRSQRIMFLTGTSNVDHMSQDLEVPGIILTAEELDTVSMLLIS